MSPGPLVAVALSGGVDSSTAAALLKEQGYQVQGITLQFQAQPAREDAGTCCGDDAILQARRAAEVLGIDHRVVDCSAAFEEQILRAAWAEYDRGRTPNPCIHCNAQIKFGLLLEHALAHGARFLATGHYARIARQDTPSPRLCRGKDLHKDQSYFLFALSPRQLQHTLFPLGDHTKDEIRELARGFGLPNAERAESQDACFKTPEAGFAEALRLRFDRPAQPGDFVDSRGQRLGRHPGIHLFTVGQRRGHGLALGQRAYVMSIDPNSSQVMITTEEQDLEAGGLVARETSWAVPPQGRLEVEVQIRYRHQAVPAVIEREEHQVRVHFQQPQRAVTPGQAAVFYQGSTVIGGGWIHAVIAP